MSDTLSIVFDFIRGLLGEVPSGQANGSGVNPEADYGSVLSLGSLSCPRLSRLFVMERRLDNGFNAR